MRRRPDTTSNDGAPPCDRPVLSIGRSSENRPRIPPWWVPDEHGAPTVVVEGITLVFKTDYQSTFTDRRLHAADVPIRSLAQLGRLIQRTDREVSP